jgi:hypothetical protein
MSCQNVGQLFRLQRPYSQKLYFCHTCFAKMLASCSDCRGYILKNSIFLTYVLPECWPIVQIAEAVFSKTIFLSHMFCKNVGQSFRLQRLYSQKQYFSHTCLARMLASCSDCRGRILKNCFFSHMSCKNVGQLFRLQRPYSRKLYFFTHVLQECWPVVQIAEAVFSKTVFFSHMSCWNVCQSPHRRTHISRVRLGSVRPPMWVKPTHIGCSDSSGRIHNSQIFSHISWQDFVYLFEELRWPYLQSPSFPHMSLYRMLFSCGGCIYKS